MLINSVLIIILLQISKNKKKKLVSMINIFRNRIEQKTVGMLKVFIVLLGLFLGVNSFAATITSAGTGNWSDGTKWVGGVAPGSGDDVIIASGHTITVNGTYSCNTLVINAAGASNGITISSSNSLNVGAGAGSVTMNAVTTNSVSSTLAVGTGSLTCGNISMTGSSTGTQNTILSVSTGTITCTGISFSGTAAQAKLTFSSTGNLNISGNLGSGGTFTSSTGTVNFNGSTAQTFAGYSYNIIKINNTAGVTPSSAPTIATLTIADVTSGSIFNDGAYAVSTATTLNLNNGTYNCTAASFPWGTLNAGTGTVNYSLAGSQTVAAKTYYNLGISGGSNNVKTLGGTPTTVSNVLTIAASTSLDFGITTARTLTLSGIGANTLVNSGTINMSGSNAAHVLEIAASSIASYNNLTPGTGSTVKYTVLAGGQTIGSTWTYNNLTLLNTSLTNTAAGNISVGGVLTTTASGIFDLGTNTLSVTGTPSHAGILKTQNTTSTPITTGKTWGGTVEYNGSAAQTVSSGTYATLKVNNSLGASLGGASTVTTLTIADVTSGSIFNDGAYTVTTATTLNLNNGTYNCTAASFPWGTLNSGTGAVNYSLAGSQTVAAKTYYNLGISGGSNNVKTLGGTPTTVSNVLTIAASTSLDFGITTARTLTLSGIGANTLVNSGTINMSGSNAAHVLEIAASSIASYNNLTPGTGSTVKYTVLAGGQTIGSTWTYNNLTLLNTSLTNTAAGNISVGGVLTTTASGIFDLGTNTLSVTGTPSHAGILKTQNTTSTPITTGKTWGGTVEYNGASGQTVMAGTYNNLTLTTAQTFTASGSLVVNGTITITNSSGILD